MGELKTKFCGSVLPIKTWKDKLEPTGKALSTPIKPSPKRPGIYVDLTDKSWRVAKSEKGQRVLVVEDFGSDGATLLLDPELFTVGPELVKRWNQDNSLGDELSDLVSLPSYKKVERNGQIKWKKKDQATRTSKDWEGILGKGHCSKERKELAKNLRKENAGLPTLIDDEKKVRPLSQNLSYRTYCEITALADTWGQIYRELAGLSENQEKKESSEIPPDTGEWRKFLAETPEHKVENEHPNPDRATIEIDHRPVKAIGQAIKEYLSKYIRKKGSKTGILGRDLFKKREELDYQDLIGEAWFKRKDHVFGRNHEPKPGLYELVRDYGPDKGDLFYYAKKNLKWKIHNLCKDPHWQKHGRKKYADFESYSDRSLSDNQIAEKLGEEKGSERFRKRKRLEEARGNLDEHTSLDKRLAEGASGGLEKDPFGFEIDTVKNGWNMRFQVALETELTARQGIILGLLVENYPIKSKRETDIENLLEWHPNLDGIKERQIKTKRDEAFENLREKFPDEIIDNSHFNPENLDNWEIIEELGDDEYREGYGPKLLEHKEEVRKRQEEEKKDRIQAGFNFGSWPKDSNGYPLLYTQNKDYKPKKEKIDVSKSPIGGADNKNGTKTAL